MSDVFGQWLTDAKTGTAHYVLGGKCLCGAAVKTFGGPPERKAGPVPGGLRGFVTPLCVACIDLNAARWRGGKGRPATIRTKSTYWWRKRKTGTR
jgi:hypothetical protein